MLNFISRLPNSNLTWRTISTTANRKPQTANRKPQTAFSLIVFAILAFSQMAFSQEGNYKPLSDCENHNKFTRSGFNEQLRYFSDTILPNGLIVFNRSRVSEIGNISEITDLLQLEKESSFKLVMETASRLDNSIYQRYQQYYKGVEVDGGGYSKNIPSEPDPCLGLYSLSAYVASDINLDVTPKINQEKLEEIIFQNFAAKNQFFSSNLKITHNLLNDCAYKLAWEVSYFDTKSKISWIDAKTGVILKTIDGDQQINAPTEIYGIKNLVDLTANGTTKLESPDGSIKAFDFSSFNIQAKDPNDNTNCQLRQPSDFTSNFLVSTTQSQWTTTVAPAAVYQSFHVVTIAKKFYKQLGIDFKKINIGINCLEANAFALSSSTVDSAFILIGNNGTNSLGLFDVIAHELGHTFLNKFLGYNNVGNASLHEAISDMFGTFIESLAQGNTDWVIGDDVTAIGNLVNRNLQTPNFNCFDQVKDFSFNQRHKRSEPLGHWFFLTSQGDKSKGIPALGMQKVLEIILDALSMMSKNSDYADLKEKTLLVVEKKYGRCSDEATAIGNAWAAICVGGKYASCNFIIKGPDIVCEEKGYLSLCISDYISSAKYRWYFPMGWKVNGSTSSNSVENTECIEVTGFPKYPYYPQYLTVSVYSPSTGVSVEKNIKLIDCNGDDNPCNGLSGKVVHNGSTPKILYNRVTTSMPVSIKVFDVLGKIVYNGSESDLNNIDLSVYTGILFYVYFDELGQPIKTEKRVYIK